MIPSKLLHSGEGLLLVQEPLPTGLPSRTLHSCSIFAPFQSLLALHPSFRYVNEHEYFLTTASLTNFPTLILPPASLCLATSFSIHMFSCWLQTATWCNTSSAPPPLIKPLRQCVEQTSKQKKKTSQECKTALTSHF